MRFFVASWFFPPSTSSEGIVSYKLFRNSKHTYDVCSSKSRLWSYEYSLPLDADNIHVFPIDTDDLNLWVKEAVKTFELLHEQMPYDAVMTRSMPPESIEVARQIKQKYPDIPWVASLADPIAKSPYDIKALVNENSSLSEQDKKDFRAALKAGTNAWKTHPSPEIQQMCRLKDIEDQALTKADALIFPCSTLRSYVMGSRRRPHLLVVPHSFDRSLYPTSDTAELPHPNKDTVTFAFLGHSDDVRSLEPLVRALNQIRISNPSILKHIKMRFIGHVNEAVRTLIYNYYLFDVISLEDDVDYQTSLKIMQDVDWLIHVDANFAFLEEPGGSVYFAGKIADYLGCNAPILGITGQGTPAADIISQAGGVCVEQTDLTRLVSVLKDIAEGRLSPVINRSFRDRFEAGRVAEIYDRKIEEALSSKEVPFQRAFWPSLSPHSTSDKKLISICVPAYNVESYLDRCLFSLVSCSQARELEVIVVNDGSKDATSSIAHAYAQQYPDVFKVIDKQNGGHGSTINAALKIATGMYFRVLDGDDWMDSSALATLITNIRKKDLYADLVSTNYQQVYIEDGHEVPWMKIGAQANYRLFHFAEEDFSQEYFTLASMMVKTDILKKAGLELQEHTFYVDVEYILIPIPYIDTVMFTPEFVYRYAVGNADQSINQDNFVKRYDHHDRVLKRMLRYRTEHVARMNKSQIIYMDAIFERLLFSHYTLSLIWDADRARGFKRAQDFDNFLKKVDPKLYAWSGEKWNYVKLCRSANFNAEVLTTKPAGIAEGTSSLLYQNLSNIARQHARGKIMQHLIYNRATRTLAKRIHK